MGINTKCKFFKIKTCIKFYALLGVYLIPLYPFIFTIDLPLSLNNDKLFLNVILNLDLKNYGAILRCSNIA